MLKKRREKLMLINYIKSLFSMLTIHQSRVIFSLALTLILSACSVTPDSGLSNSQELNAVSTKNYTEAISEMKSGKLKRAQVL